MLQVLIQAGVSSYILRKSNFCSCKTQYYLKREFCTGNQINQKNNFNSIQMSLCLYRGKNLIS